MALQPQGGLWAQAPTSLSLQREVFGPFSGEDFSYGLSLSSRPGSRPRSQTPGPAPVLTPQGRQGSRPASRPPRATAANGCEVDLAGSLVVGDELQRAKDEKLLEMLGEIAKGASDDDEISSTVLDMLPIEVQEDDPTLRAMLVECGRAWEEVQAEADGKKELQARLTRELRQIQDRSSRQHQESSALTNRLVSAKQTLAEKLKEAAAVHQDLRVRITDEWRGNERLRLSMSDGVKNLATLAEDLNKQIVDVGLQQARLVEELEQASEVQARLQSELQDERVRTWRQSTDVVMAFARGGVAGAYPEGGFDLGRGDSSTLSDPSSPSKRPLENSGDDLNAQLWAERSNLLLAKNSSAEEQAELERRCKHQAQRIAELNKELALEDASRAQLDLQLEDFLTRARSCGVELRAPTPVEQDTILAEKFEEFQEDGVKFDFMAYFREVSEICEELQDKELECRSAVEEHAEAQEALQAEREEMDTLRTHLLMSESEQVDRVQRLGDSSAEAEQLKHEVHVEQAMLRELEQTAGQTRTRLRTNLNRQRDELQQLVDRNQQLINELDAREASGCFRRRQPPPGGPVRQEFGSKGSPRRPGQPPTGTMGKGSSSGKGVGGKRGGQPPPTSRGGKGGFQGRPYDEAPGRPNRGGGGNVFAEDV